MSTTKQQYTIIVGESGNEQGHATESRHSSDAAAIRKARALCAEYQGDGWYIIHDDRGETIADGGRRTL